jgi:hypothetical protein
MKLSKSNGKIIINLPLVETIKDAVIYCVENKINLSGVDLSGVDLSGANLSWVDLSGANLSWANLSGANLSGANLSGANLSGANLSGANLSWANLSWANLSWAITQNCYRFGHFSKIGGRSCFFYKKVESDSNYVIIAGCFSGTVDEFEAACKKYYPDNSKQAYEAQIAYLKTILI